MGSGLNAISTLFVNPISRYLIFCLNLIVTAPCVLQKPDWATIAGEHCVTEGDMPALLKFPCPGLVSKIRYGLVAFTSTKRRDRRKLNSEGAAICYVPCYWRLIMFVDRCLPTAYWRVPRYSVVLGLRG